MKFGTTHGRSRLGVGGAKCIGSYGRKGQCYAFLFFSFLRACCPDAGPLTFQVSHRRFIWCFALDGATRFPIVSGFLLCILVCSKCWLFFVCFHGQRGLGVARWSHRLCVGWCSFLGCAVVFRLLGRIPYMFVLRAYFCSLLWLWSFVFSPRTAP